MKIPESPTQTQNRLMVFVHVPKAAGTTLRAIIDNLYGQTVHRCDVHLYPSALDDLRNLPADQKAKIRCLMGHLPYGIHKYVSVHADYVTVLRDPVDRFLSKYAYLRNNEWVAKQLRVTDKQIESLEAFIDLQLARHAMNFQTRQISGCVDLLDPMPPFAEPVSFDTLQTAQKNLKDDFAVVGLQDRFNESLLLMKSAFGWGNVCYRRKNVTTRSGPRNDVSRRTRDLIEQHNELDMELLEYSRKLFEERILAYGPRFKEDLRVLERKNERYSERLAFRRKAKGLVRKIGRLVAHEAQCR